MENNILKYIANIEHNLALIKELLGKPQVDISDERLIHLNKLTNIDSWPEAIDKSDIAEDTVEHQIDRARIVLDTILDESLEGKNFLDFGCGQGYFVREAASRGATAIGYDLIDHNWGSDYFTTNLDSLKPNSFDVILLYDVIDHIVDVPDPIVVMERIRSLLKKHGTVYVRCHPWTSKHATHLPKIGLNKAFIHLFMKWEELEALGYKQIPTRTETNPIAAYRYWFKNFKILDERMHREPVSDFFFVPSFKQLIIDEQHLEGDRKEHFFNDMSLTYIDYKLINK